MTSKNEKLRGLFLAAIMVTSVFVGSIAFAGTAAAANDASTIDASPDLTGETSTHSVDITVESNDDSSSLNNIEIDYSVGANPADISNVEQGDVTVEYQGNDISSDVDGVSASNNGNQLDISLGGSTTLAEGEVVSVSVDNVENPSLSSSTTEDVEVALNTQSTDNPFTTTVSYTDSGDVDLAYEPSQTIYYQGQQITATGLASGTDYQLRSVDETDTSSPASITSSTFEEELNSNSDGEITIDTSELETDSYFIRGPGVDEDTSNAFELTTMELSAEFAEDSVNDESSVDLSFSSNRGTYNVNVSADGLDQSNLEDIFSEDVSYSDDTVELQGVSDNDDISADFSGIDTGNYTFDFESTDTTATASDDIEVTEAAEGDAQIIGVENDQRGDVANITVGLTGTDQATVTLGSEESGYEANVTVTDGDGDDEVTLQWNTFLADDDGDDDITVFDEDQFIAAGDDDDEEILNVTTSIGDGDDHIIASGTYDVAVTTGTQPAADATDLDSVTLSPRGSQNIQTWTAPEGADEILDEVTTDSAIASDDYLVVQVESTGLEGAFAQSDFDTLAGNEPDDGDVFNINATESVGQASNQQPEDITSDDVESFVADTQNDTYYAVYDTSDLDVEAGDDFDVLFTVFAKQSGSSNFGLVAPEGGEFEDETLEDSFEIVERTGAIDTRSGSDLVEVSQASGQTITGTSTVAPGTELNVRVQSQSGSGSQFVIGPRTVEVTEDNTWSIEADFSSYDVGTEFGVTLSEPGANSNLDTADGVIQGPPEVIALEVSDQEGAGEVVSIDEVELNQGGFIAIHQGSPSGDVIGNSEYIDPNENVQNLRFVLDETLNSSATLYAMPHQDDNNNEEYDFPEADAPYTEGGSAVTAEFDYTLAGATADFQVSNLNPMDVTVTAGDVINVSATITNEGNAAGTQDVEFRVGGSVIDSQEVSLDSGASQDVEFTNIDTTGLSGELDHGVFTDDGDQTATLTVEAPTDGNDTTPTTEEPTTEEPTTEEPTTEEPATEEPTDEPTDDETTTTTGPGFGAIVALVALLGAALLAVRRNN